MNRDNVQAWIADLRANGHLQGQGVLESEDGKFCCLGRAAVLAGCDRTVDIAGRIVFGIEHVVSAPPQVSEWLGVDIGSLGCLPGYGQLLSALNDDGVTFVEIADIIEAALLGDAS
jgi:hypothetical protein